MIGVIAQKDSNVEEPQISDLEEISTIAKIVKLIKMPMEAQSSLYRDAKGLKLKEISEEPYFKAKIKTLTEDTLKGDKDFEAMVGSIKRTGRANNGLSQPAHEATIILKILKTLLFNSFCKAAILIVILKEKQRLLVINDIKSQMLSC